MRTNSRPWRGTAAIAVFALATILRFHPALAAGAWTAHFDAKDKDGQWQELSALADKGFELRAQESRQGGAARTKIHKQRAMLFFQAASLADLWGQTYFNTTESKRTADYIYLKFTNGLYWEYADDAHDAAIAYSEVRWDFDERLRQGLASDESQPTYNGSPVSSLLREHIKAVEDMLTPPVFSNLMASRVFGNSSPLEIEKAWIAVALAHPKRFAVGAAVNAFTGPDHAAEQGTRIARVESRPSTGRDASPATSQ